MITLSCTSGTLTLSNPKLGEPNQLSTGILAHYSANGTLRTYLKPITEKYVLTFDTLTDNNLSDLETWLADYDGSVITYTDWLANVLQVRLLTTQLVITKLRECQYSTILEIRKV